MLAPIRFALPARSSGLNSRQNDQPNGFAFRILCLSPSPVNPISDLARGPPSINTLAVIESSAIVFWPRYHQQDLPTAFLFLGDAQEADVRQQSREYQGTTVQT
ncbi:hypothetical protein MRB53_021874 [Persea americana]|uniref:Uncharacterized protein n=1 Tax=Persea americana TaxID=3435 RepID=A0ACC2L5U0_PERAE|nr:hypothetical protein MRB53_021874 [Persea americana]